MSRRKIMVNVTETKRVDKIIGVAGSGDEYRNHMKKLIETTIKGVLDQEIQKAAQELMEEQRKAIRQIVDDYKITLQQIVDEEKKSIWLKAEDIKKSILDLSL